VLQIQITLTLPYLASRFILDLNHSARRHSKQHSNLPPPQQLPVLLNPRGQHKVQPRLLPQVSNLNLQPSNLEHNLQLSKQDHNLQLSSLGHNVKPSDLDHNQNEGLEYLQLVIAQYPLLTCKEYWE